MGYYLVRCDYHSSAWAELLTNKKAIDESRLDPVSELAKNLGGGFAQIKTPDGVAICKFISFGGADLIGIVEFPDDPSARAFSMAISAEPGVKNFEITPMLHFHDGIGAMNLARKQRKKYIAPGRAGTK